MKVLEHLQNLLYSKRNIMFVYSSGMIVLDNLHDVIVYAKNNVFTNFELEKRVVFE